MTEIVNPTAAPVMDAIVKTARSRGFTLACLIIARYVNAYRAKNGSEPNGGQVASFAIDAGLKFRGDNIVGNPEMDKFIADFIK